VAYHAQTARRTDSHSPNAPTNLAIHWFRWRGQGLELALKLAVYLHLAGVQRPRHGCPSGPDEQCRRDLSCT
jgi:hypothetical protein